MQLVPVTLDLTHLELKLELVEKFMVGAEPLHEELVAPWSFPRLARDRRIGIIFCGTVQIMQLGLC